MGTELELVRKHTCVELGEELFLEIKELVAGTQAVNQESMSTFKTRILQRVEERDIEYYHNKRNFRQAIDDMFMAQWEILHEISGECYDYIKERFQEIKESALSEAKGQAIFEIVKQAGDKHKDLAHEVNICTRLLAEQLKSGVLNEDEALRQETSKRLAELLEHQEQSLLPDACAEDRVHLLLARADALKNSQDLEGSLAIYNCILENLQQVHDQASSRETLLQVCARVFACLRRDCDFHSRKQATMVQLCYD